MAAWSPRAHTPPAPSARLAASRPALAAHAIPPAPGPTCTIACTSAGHCAGARSASSASAAPSSWGRYRWMASRPASLMNRASAVGRKWRGHPRQGTHTEVCGCAAGDALRGSWGLAGPGCATAPGAGTSAHGLAWPSVQKAAGCRPAWPPSDSGMPSLTRRCPFHEIAAVELLQQGAGAEAHQHHARLGPAGGGMGGTAVTGSVGRGRGGDTSGHCDGFLS